MNIIFKPLSTRSDLFDKIKHNTDPYNRPSRNKKAVNQFRNNRKFRRSK